MDAADPPAQINGHPLIDHQLEVLVDADPYWMPSLRALATDLAIRADFDLDAVADFALAVDEACALLIRTSAQPTQVMSCRFAVTLDRITVTVAVPSDRTARQQNPPAESFGWRVLTTLTDEIELLDASRLPARHRFGLWPNGTESLLGIRLCKQRMAAGG